MGVVLVHQPGGGPVEPGHGVHGSLVRLPDIILGDDKFDPRIKFQRNSPKVSPDTSPLERRLAPDHYRLVDLYRHYGH